MKQIIRNYFLILTLTICVANANNCVNVGDLQVYNDPTCVTSGGAGCNAGGQGMNCRFCGFGIFPSCPSVEVSTVPTTPKSSPTTRTTITTTKKPTEKPVIVDNGADNNSTNNNGNGSGNNGNNNGCGCSCQCGNNNNNNNNEAGLGELNSYGEKLIFSDDFDYFDLKKWKHDLTLSGGGNWEFQLYHNNRSNSYVKNGKLIIKPTLTSERIGENNLRNGYRMEMWGGSPVDQCTGNNFYGCERTSGAGGNILNPIQSAKLTTINSLNFKYGRAEIRAKLPKGDWLWPAIWLLPARNIYGMWPASGEIDIMESRGNENYPASAEGGVESFGSTLHWGADWTQNRYTLTHSVYEHSSKLSDDFHTYGLYWDEDRLYTYFDDPDNIVLDVDLRSKSFWERGNFSSSYQNPWENSDESAPFNEEFYLIINLAVGGTAGYFKDGVAGKPWSDKSSSSVNEFYAAKDRWYSTWNNPDNTFEIDSVKVWSLNKNK